MKNIRKPPSRRRAQSGFTLVEVLLTGVIGAVLLTSVSYATLSFSLTVAHLEKEAGESTAEEIVLRRMTRDIREAWWVELVDPRHIKLADENGDFSEYYLDDSDLVQVRADGTQGVLLEEIEELLFEIVDDSRFRESSVVTLSGTWYETEPSFGAQFAYELPKGAELSLGFAAPVYSEDVPASGVTDEQILDLSADVLSIPLAWAPGTAEENLQVELYTTLGPGLAEPIGAALGTLTISGATLPQAVLLAGEDDEYEKPTEDVSLSLSSLGIDFEPGTGYAVVLKATGDAQLVFKCRGNYANDKDDLLAVSDATGGDWVDMEFFVLPYLITGEFSMTSTTVDTAITGISVTLTPKGRPTMTRSAAVLSQTVSESPWYGVLPGEEAP